MSAKIIDSNAGLVLYQVAPGKPDQKDQAVREGEMRGRVVQTALKGGVNWYYTMNFIRKRIGKNHAEDLRSERQNEAFFSAFRKKKTRFYDEMPSVCNQLDSAQIQNLLRGVTQPLNRANLRDWDQSILGLLDKEMEGLEEGYVGLKGSSVAFAADSKGFTNLYDYLLDYRMNEHSQCVAGALAQLGIEPKRWYEEKILAYLPGGPAWERITEEFKKHYSQGMIVLLAAEKYGLKYASWRPSDPIERLIESIRDNGPHHVGTTLNSRSYKSAPFCLKDKIGGRKIYGWKPGTPKGERSNFGTTILLVGAKKENGTELVYFIDAEDGSDPKDVEKQKIYVVSYKTLRENMCDLYGTRANVGFETPLPHALHG